MELIKRLSKKNNFDTGSGEYEYQSKDSDATFDSQVKALKKRVKNRVLTGWPSIKYSEEENRRLIQALNKQIKPVVNFKIDLAEYRRFIERVGYETRYPDYYSFNFPEKTLEHFIAYKLLNLKKGDRFIDIAAEHSPHNEAFSRLTGCIGYKQDIMFPPGIEENRIGGDASALPVENNFFQAALAACSLEHFEREADIRFMKEMSRVLSPGGKIVIIPLYLHSRPFYVTDPRYSVPGRVRFESGIDIHCVEEYRNRHGRFYSPETLFKRLIRPNRNRLDFTVYYIENFRAVDESVYCRFALVGEKINPETTGC